MNLTEFSDGFDVLVDSYKRFTGFDDREAFDTLDFNEYEKSVFLTKAQEELVQALYAGEHIEGESYEETERLRRHLSSLNAEASIEPLEDHDYIGISSDSKFFELPCGVWFITYESIRASSEDSCINGKDVEVIPVRQDWFHRQVRNPFRGATTSRALRLDKSGNVVEIVYPSGIEYYYVRYMRRPLPIILETLPNGLSIEDISEATECGLHSTLHQKILDRAVLLALQSRGISPNQPKQEER